MSNLGSIAGGAVWMAVATLLIFATLEPVTVEKGAGSARIAAAQQTAATSAARL